MAGLVTRTVFMFPALVPLTDTPLADVPVPTLVISIALPDTFHADPQVDVAVLVRGTMIVSTEGADEPAVTTVAVESIVTVIIAIWYLPMIIYAKLWRAFVEE